MFYNVFCFFFVLVPTPVATAYNMFIENSDVCISKITRGIKEKGGLKQPNIQNNRYSASDMFKAFYL